VLGSTFLSFIAGLVTILNPFFMPLVLALVASAFGKSKFGPLALAGGHVSSFTLFGFTTRF
jgi:cytochrome c-type biogenesis protein